jgi:hypothetical protein
LGQNSPAAGGLILTPGLAHPVGLAMPFVGQRPAWRQRASTSHGTRSATQTAIT